MSDLDFKPADVDHSIPDVFSTGDISAWLFAKVTQARAAGLPVHAVSAHIHVNPDGSGFATWYAHACGECATSRSSFEDAIQNLRALLLNNPESGAAAKRAQAEALLRDAERLEALAKEAEARK